MRLQERTEHRAALRLVDATEHGFADTQPARESDCVDIDAVHRSHAWRIPRQRRIDGWAVAGLLICVASAGVALGGAALLMLQLLP